MLLGSLGLRMGTRKKSGKATALGTWTSVTLPYTGAVYALCHGNGVWLLGYAATQYVMRSTDGGLNWDRVSLPTPNSSVRRIIHDGERFILARENGQVLYSADGTSFTTLMAAPSPIHTSSLTSIAFADGYYTQIWSPAANGESPVSIAVSRRRTTLGGSPSTSTISTVTGMIFDHNGAAVRGSTILSAAQRLDNDDGLYGGVLRSADGGNSFSYVGITTKGDGYTRGMLGVAFGENSAVVVGPGIFVSTDDGLTYSDVGVSYLQNAVCNADGLLVTLTTATLGGMISYDDGVSWSSFATSISGATSTNDMAFGNGVILASLASGTILRNEVIY